MESKPKENGDKKGNGKFYDTKEKSWAETNINRENLVKNQVESIKKLLDANVLPPLDLLNLVKNLSPKVANAFAEEVIASKNFPFREVYNIYLKIKSECTEPFIVAMEVGIMRREDTPKHIAINIRKDQFKG